MEVSYCSDTCRRKGKNFKICEFIVQVKHVKILRIVYIVEVMEVPRDVNINITENYPTKFAWKKASFR